MTNDNAFRNLLRKLWSEAQHWVSTGNASAGLNLASAISPQHAGALKVAAQRGDRDEFNRLVEDLLTQVQNGGRIKVRPAPRGRGSIRVRN